MTFPSSLCGDKRRRSGMRVDTILANTNKNKQTTTKKKRRQNVFSLKSNFRLVIFTWYFFLNLAPLKIKRKWLYDEVLGAVLSDMRAIKTLFLMNRYERKRRRERTSRHFKKWFEVSSRQWPLTASKYYARQHHQSLVCISKKCISLSFFSSYFF